MTLIERIILMTMIFSVPFCIALFDKKKKSDSLRDFLAQKKYIIIVFVVLLGLWTWYLIWKDGINRQRYQQIYEHSINNMGTVTDYGKAELKIQLQNGREYIFSPDNNIMISSDIIRYTTEMGYRIKKKANSDTIFLVKGDSIKFCLIKKPR